MTSIQWKCERMIGRQLFTGAGSQARVWHGNRRLLQLSRRCLTAWSKNPYVILGVPPSSSFRVVQKAFIKLALQHHPDTAASPQNSTNSDSGTKGTSDFVRIRQAFERIRRAHQEKTQGHMSMDDPPENSEINLTEDDFLDYFHKQTGVQLTSDQRRELVHLYRTRARGGFYGGHSWELARRLVLEQDAFLRNMEQMGASSPPGSSRGTRRNPSAFQRERQSGDPHPSGKNLRRKRQR